MPPSTHLLSCRQPHFVSWRGWSGWEDLGSSYLKRQTEEAAASVWLSHLATMSTHQGHLIFVWGTALIKTAINPCIINHGEDSHTAIYLSCQVLYYYQINFPIESIHHSSSLSPPPSPSQLINQVIVLVYGEKSRQDGSKRVDKQSSKNYVHTLRLPCKYKGKNSIKVASEWTAWLMLQFQFSKMDEGKKNK